MSDTSSITSTSQCKINPSRKRPFKRSDAFEAESKDSADEIAAGEDVSEEPFRAFLTVLTSFYLTPLETIFAQITRDKTTSGSAMRRERGLTKTEFVEAVSDMFAEENYTVQAIRIFNEIDKDEEYHEISWMQLLDYLTHVSKVKAYPKVEFGRHKIMAVPHVMRDTITKIVLIESRKYFCYAVISKYGRVGLYDGNLNFLISYHVVMTRDDVVRTDEERRRRNRWITDAVYLPDLFMLLITNTTRSIAIYDASGLKHVPIWLIIGFPDIIHSISYFQEEATNTCVLYVGDENGTVTSFTFLQSRTGLFRRKHNDKLTIFYWNEIRHESKFVLVKSLYKAHNDVLKKIQYFPEKKLLVTCSCDPKSSVVIRSLIHKRKPYVFSMRRGCSTYSLTQLTLITGSDDGTIRIWDSVMPSKPLAVLNKNQCGIVDLVTMEFLPYFITCSRDGLIQLWDIKDETRLQQLTLDFPPFHILGKSIEWGINSIYPGPCRQPLPEDSNERPRWQRTNILITCCNYLATINLIFHSEDYRKNFETPVLIPPPLQNSVLIPKSWEVTQDAHRQTTDLALDFLNDTNSDDIEINENVIEERIKSLSFILERNLLDELNLKHNINKKIARLEEKKVEMQLSVQRCAPFLALELQTVDEVQLKSDLPVPNRKKIRNLTESLHKMLSDASFRNIVFSEPTSSSRLTSRSSIVEFV